MRVDIGRFKDLSDNKNKILKMLYDNDDVTKCLINNNEDFILSNIPNDFDRTSLVYSQMYPFRYIPETTINPKTFITIRSKYNPYKEFAYRYNTIYFYVITHKDIVGTDNGLRYDFLIDKIDEIFSLSKEFKSSRLQFDDMDEFIIDPYGKWMGSYICYKSLGF